MSYHTIGEDWLDYAKLVPVGQSRRANHDCKRGGKLALIYGNDTKGYWARCFRCQFSGYRTKTHTQYRRPEPQRRAIPTDIVPLVDIIAKNPYQLQPVLERYQILPYISMLTASEQFGRIYLPDDTASYCGLDYTSTQFAWWYSPIGSALAARLMPDAVTHLYHNPVEYLQAVRNETSAVFVPTANVPTLQAVAANLMKSSATRLVVHRHPDELRIRREISVVGIPIELVTREDAC